VNSILQIDEFASMSISTAAAPITQNGEAVQVVLAGDPLQLEPRPLSKISDRLSGRLTLLDLLAKSRTYFQEMNVEEWSVQRDAL
jgi:superfamily I DNA and/or RNA helicase